MNKNVLYAFFAAVFVGAVGFAFFPHIIEHTPTLVDKKFIVKCAKVGRTFEISVSNKGFSPRIIQVDACDKIIFENTEKKSFFQPAFGDHPVHLAYPGFAEKIIGPGKQNFVIMSAYGTYKIHDHIKDEIEGEIIVSHP